MVSQPQHPVLRRRQFLSMYHIQVSLKRGLVAPWITVRANGNPAPAHPPHLPHLHRRGENDSNALGYGGIAVTVIGVIIAALGVFRGWKCWKNRRSSMKRVRTAPTFCGGGGGGCVLTAGTRHRHTRNRRP